MLLSVYHSNAFFKTVSKWTSPSFDSPGGEEV